MILRCSCARLSGPISLRYFHSTPANNLNRKWRQERGLPNNPNAYGILTDAPDYTFLDGRPTPYGAGQRERLEKNQKLTEQIIQLSAEIDFAVERHKQMKVDEENRRKQIIDGKLKAKGAALLKKD